MFHKFVSRIIPALALSTLMLSALGGTVLADSTYTETRVACLNRVVNANNVKNTMVLVGKNGQKIEIPGNNNINLKVMGNNAIFEAATPDGLTLMAMDLTTRKLRRLIPDDLGVVVSPFDVSPDGTKVVFGMTMPGGTTDGVVNPNISGVYITDLKATSPNWTKLTSTYGDGVTTDPVFSPDGNTVAYIDPGLTYADVYTIGVNGLNKVKVVNGQADGSQVYALQWTRAPKGAYLTYQSISVSDSTPS